MQLRRLSKVYPSLGVSRRVAYAWAREGKMPAMCINGTWLVDVEQFELWVLSHRVEQAAAIAVREAKQSPLRRKPVREKLSASPGAGAIAAKRKRWQTIDHLSALTGLSRQFISNNLRAGVPSKKLLGRLEAQEVKI